jgi:hypothetical protein
MNERDLIQRLNAADAAEFAQMLRGATPEDARVLKLYFGENEFEHIRQMALKASTTRGITKGSVVVLHGILGGELTLYEHGIDAEQIWISIPRLILGQFVKLALDNGIERIEATGILKRYYGEQLLRLLHQGWNARAFWYDWRLDIRTTAKKLKDQLLQWFPDPHREVHFVAHSMGGLVVRSFLSQFPKEWPKGKLIMLGTPNNGSFKIPQMFAGWNSVLKMVDLLDPQHKMLSLLKVVYTFPSGYQMLPSRKLLKGESEFAVWSPQSYAGNPPNSLFSSAEVFWKSIEQIADPQRMIYVAGVNQLTAVGVCDAAKLGNKDGYEFSFAGDGTVSHRLGLLTTTDGAPIPTFYTDVEHGAMPNNKIIGDGVDQLLEDRGHGELRQEPGIRFTSERGARLLDAALEISQHEEEWQNAASAVVQQIKDRGPSMEAAIPSLPFRSAESEAEELLVTGFLSPQESGKSEPSALDHLLPPDASVKLSIQLQVRFCGIETDFDIMGKDSLPPVDAISVGHYVDVMPSASEGALSIAISQVQAQSVPLDRSLLSELTRRGVIHCGLGEIFTLADPRRVARTIMLAGMGDPGHFGRVELRSCARQLLWLASRLGKKHLATVLIGAGQGNVSVENAVMAWASAIYDVLKDGTLPTERLQLITICENAPQNVETISEIFSKTIQRLELAERIKIVPLEAADLTGLKRAKEQITRQALTSPVKQQQASSRLTATYDGKRYTFSAMTISASVPERFVTLDKTLVEEANDQFPGLSNNEEQQRQGRFLKRLLLPDDFDPVFQRTEPVVVVCDSTTANLHWETICLPETVGDTSGGHFLGIERGMTRQFKSELAPMLRKQSLTKGPSISDRIFKVLIISDPAADNPLPGAFAEGEAVAKFFFSLRNRLRQADISSAEIRDIQVEVLSGPSKATRLQVLKELVQTSYDIMHYCGHCVYDKSDPTKSGWIFTGGQRLTANELRRIGQAPIFVFSNACESGITPDRSDRRSAGMPATFAESFFAQGVQNFVCTAWPVNDEAARLFATTFYSTWLDATGSVLKSRPIYEAMREARIAVSNMGKALGLGTWGAYQHYGDPHAVLF